MYGIRVRVCVCVCVTVCKYTHTHTHTYTIHSLYKYISYYNLPNIVCMYVAYVCFENRDETLLYETPRDETSRILPQQSKRDPLGKRGFWVGMKLVKCRKSKKPQPNQSLNNTVRKLAS